MTRPKHGGNIKEVSEFLRKAESEIIDFSSSLSPLRFDISRAFRKTEKEIHTYPDDRYSSFRKAAADYIGVSPENIIPGNGSTELIRIFVSAFGRNAKVLVQSPSYQEYEYNCRIFGAEVGYINIKQNLKSISADIIFLCNPNNPTGELLPREKVIEIAKVCKKLFVDEVFIELSDPRQSVAEFASTRENIFVLRSLTKCFALPGLRIGYGVAGKEMIKELEKYRPPWNLNSIGSELGIFCLTDGKKHLERVREFVKSEREWMVEQLRSAGFHARKSDANFILIRCGNASETRRKLLDENILVRDCTSFGLPDYIRVAVKRRRENRKLINALRMIK